MPKEKVYTIFYNADYFYLPIKSDSIRYPKPKSEETIECTPYSPNYPNFFGGTKEDRKDLLQTLKDEVGQESQQKFELDIKSLSILPIFKAGTEEEGTYLFYALDTSSLNKAKFDSLFKENEILQLAEQVGATKPQEHEFRAIVRFDRKTITTIDKLIEHSKRLGFCADKTCIRKGVRKTNEAEFNESHTKRALEEFFK